MQENTPSKKVRIAAVAGIVLLVLMYLVALVCALIDHPLATSILWTALFSTLVIPVMIYVFQLCVRRFTPKDQPKKQ